MKDQQYRNEIDQLRNSMATLCLKSHVGVIVPACMEIVLNAIMAAGEQDKGMAIRATQSLHPMVDYIEAQLSGRH